MARRDIEKQLLLIALTPAVVAVVGLALYFLALRFGDIDATFIAGSADLSLAGIAARKHAILVVTLIAVVAALAAATLLAWRLARRMADPVGELERALEQLHLGRYETRLPNNKGSAFCKIANGVNTLAATLESTLQEAAHSLAEREVELASQLGFAQAMLDAQSQAGVGLATIEYGRIVFANSAVERISGYSMAELRDMPHFVQIAHPDDRELIMRNYLNRLAGEGFEDRYDFALQRKDGELRHIQLAQTSIAAGNRVRVLGILVDISERKRAEAQLAETHRQLLVRKEEAEHSNLAKSRFLAAASHDLRQPLHALMLFAAELEAAAATVDQKRLAGQIAAATGAMGELLDALIEVSRLDTSDIAPRRQAHALGPLLDSVASAHRQSAEAKGLRIVCAATQTWADSDPHLLRRLIGNLVANAVRYTHQGGIVVGVRREGQGLRIEVWDTGIGIEAEQLPQVFQEFYQVGNRERDPGKGLGLGLAIVDRIARILGHRLHVRSIARRGSVFGISVPRTQPVAAHPEQNLEAAPMAARILVAATSPSELESLGNLLENWGYRVMRASDQRQLRTAMAAMPDMVVCDESTVDGLAQALAGRPRPRPQVVLVGEAIKGSPPRNLFLDGRLAKPVKPGRLRALLQHLLQEVGEQKGN